MTELLNTTDQTELVIVHSPEYENWVFDPRHPTQGRRFINGYNAILEKLNADRIKTVAPRKATRDELALVHTPTYLSTVLDRHMCDEWAGDRPELAELASTFVGGTLVALEQLLAGIAPVAVHLPGAKHHAQASHSSGFCVFADFAIAAKVAVARGYKVAIFDFDAHHGDGTENLCADDPNILTYSVHQSGIFPGTGYRSIPSKHVYNRPIVVDTDRPEPEPWSASDLDHEDAAPRFGTREQQELVIAAGEFGMLAAEFGANIIFIAAGADGHWDDPLSDLTYLPGILIKVIGNLCNSIMWQSPVPILIGGAGGYRPDDATPEMWSETVKCFVMESRETPQMVARRSGFLG